MPAPAQVPTGIQGKDLGLLCQGRAGAGCNSWLARVPARSVELLSEGDQSWTASSE